MPSTVTAVIPKSSAKIAICEVTISPEVDIMVIMINISQNSGLRSISFGAKLFSLIFNGLLTGCALACCGARNPWLAIKPMAAINRPNCHSVLSSPLAASDCVTGNVVRIAPIP